jgi:hypothetical protein
MVLSSTSSFVRATYSYTAVPLSSHLTDSRKEPIRVPSTAAVKASINGQMEPVRESGDTDHETQNAKADMKNIQSSPANGNKSMYAKLLHLNYC